MAWGVEGTRKDRKGKYKRAQRNLGYYSSFILVAVKFQGVYICQNLMVYLNLYSLLYFIHYNSKRDGDK